MATCPICATHYHNAFDCGEIIKKSCIANGCSMNVLEAAAQCPKCAKICICAGGHVKCHAGMQRLRRQQNASERTDRRQKRLQVQKVHVKKDHNKKSFRQRLRLAAGTTGSSAETSQKREAEPDEASGVGVGVGGVGKLNPVVSPPNHVGVSLPKRENLNFEELLSLLLAGIVPPQASQRNAELLPMISTNNPGLRGPMGNGVYLSGTILPTLQDGGANALLALSAIIASAEAIGRYGAMNDLQQVLNALQAASGGSI